MLGRYVAGTLLIMGAAMVMAPKTPQSEIADVSRARTAPATLSAGKPAEMAAATRTETRVSAPAASAPVPETTDEAAMKGGIEDALAAALELDDAEGDASADAQTAGATGVTTAGPAPRDVAALDTSDSTGVWTGLSDPNGVTEMTASSTANTAPAVDPAKQMVVTGTRVNVRSGPSTEFGVVGTVTEGQAVELVSEGSGNWAEIRFPDGGETGFMSRRFLSSSQVDG